VINFNPFAPRVLSHTQIVTWSSTPPSRCFAQITLCFSSVHMLRLAIDVCLLCSCPVYHQLQLHYRGEDGSHARLLTARNGYGNHNGGKFPQQDSHQKGENTVMTLKTPRSQGGSPAAAEEGGEVRGGGGGAEERKVVRSSRRWSPWRQKRDLDRAQAKPWM